MRAQFVKDDDGKIWFTYVKDLYVRKVAFDFERQVIMEEVQNINQQAKDNLIKEINAHMNHTREPNSINSIYNVMNNHYSGIKDEVGVDKLYQDDYLENEQDRITEDAYNTLRPESPYKLGELVSKKKFNQKKYIKNQRKEEKLLGGRCMFRSHAIKDPEELRKAILKGEVYVTSPKKFLNKKDFAELKQDSRLMHQFYSSSINAPVELNKEFRFMKKENVDLKKIK